MTADAMLPAVQSFFDDFDHFVTSSGDDKKAKEFFDFLVEHAEAGTPMFAFTTLVAFVRGMNSRNVERNEKIRALEEHNAALEKRILELEERPELKYLGVWESSKSYDPGNVVTDHGAMWVARRTPTRRPGDGDSGWQLAVQRGRDARTPR